MLFHAVPVLWRLHRVHHADLDFDVTTGVRFHPVEILLSMVDQVGGGGGARRAGRGGLVFEVLLNATSMFNHATCACRRGSTAFARLVVTPDMHRVHHSVARETNSNFGFNLPWWDHLLGTYRRSQRRGTRV